MTRLTLNRLNEEQQRKLQALPERALQFGEGNFLRGFVDSMLHKLNEQGLFNGRVVVVQPIPQGLSATLNAQDGLYTLLLRGIQDGKEVKEQEIVTSISRAINPYEQFDDYLNCARNPDLRFIFSNTTEAGIAYSQADRYDDAPPASFPGKLTVFLHKRFEAFLGDPSKGMVIIPCELIDQNGDELRRIVLRLAADWELGDDFIQWIKHANFFLNTLVDRIVTGFPHDEIDAFTKQAGYEDKLFDTAEIFHLWVIEGDERFAQELPFNEIGLNVIWTDDMTPYRTQKVRILNGAHTMTALAAYLYGVDTVKECMDDPVIRRYMEQGIYEEIMPTLDMPQEQLQTYAKSVIDRFMNPYNKHYLLSIALNSISKFKTRVLPSLLAYVEKKNELPRVLSFSLAALFAFYRGTEIRGHALIGKRQAGDEYEIVDDLPLLEMFQKLWKNEVTTIEDAQALVADVLAREDLWGYNLQEIPGFVELVANDLFAILTQGAPAAMKDVIQYVEK